MSYNLPIGSLAEKEVIPEVHEYLIDVEAHVSLPCVSLFVSAGVIFNSSHQAIP